MKLNLLLMMSALPIAIYAQDVTKEISTNEYPNTFSSGSAHVEKFNSKAKKLNDWSISVGGGASFMTNADLNSFYKNDCHDTKVDWGWNAYVSLDKQISHTFGLSLQYQTGKTNQRGQLPGEAGQLAGRARAWTKYQQVSLLGDINFSNLLRRVDNNSLYDWALHGYAGIGLQSFNTELIDNNASRWSTNPKRVPIIVEQKLNIASFFYQAGIGLKRKLSRRIDIEGRVMYIFSGDEEFDGGGWTRTQPESVNYNEINDSYSDNLFTVNLGLSFKFGKHLTHLAWYDPLQNVYARTEALNGTPDLLVCESGDKDNDSVCDDWDRQLNTPAGARVDGAGVALDMDLDGVIDLYDKCVTVPGPASNNGCPQKTTQKPAKPISTVTYIDKINQYFEGIEFALNKDIIRSKSFDKLNNAANIIKGLDTNNRFIVVGATDTRGSETYNQKLSQRRANAVVRYLVGKGVPRKMLIAEGRGESDLKYPECNPATKCDEWKNEANRRVFFEEVK